MKRQPSTLAYSVAFVLLGPFLALVLSLSSYGIDCNYTVYNGGSVSVGGINLYWDPSGMGYCGVSSRNFLTGFTGTVAPGGSVSGIAPDFSGYVVGASWSCISGTCDGPSPGCSQQIFGTMGSSGGAVTFVITPGGAAPATTNYCCTSSYLNLYTYPVTVQFYVNGLAYTGPGGFSRVEPGAVYAFVYCSPYPLTCSYNVYSTEGLPIVTNWPSTLSTNSPATNNPPPPPLDMPTNIPQSWTTNIPAFAPGASNLNAQMSTLYQGVAGVGTEVANIGAADTSSLSNQIAHATFTGTNTVNVSVTVTNNNSTQYTNLVNNTVSNNVFLTNLFSPVINFSNINPAATGSIFSGSSDMLGLVPSTATNGSAALAAALANGDVNQVGTAVADVTNGIAGALGNFTNGVMASEGSPDIFNIPFYTTNGIVGSIDLDPEVAFSPGILGLVKAGWVFVLAVSFMYWLTGWLYDFVVRVANLKGGGVPDLDTELAGFGGNAAGLIVALIVPLCIFFLTGALIYSTLESCIAAVPMLSAAVSGVSLGTSGSAPGAYYLLFHSFPVVLATTLAIERMTIPMSTAWTYYLTAMAMNYLFQE